MARCIQWQDEAGYPHLGQCAAKRERMSQGLTAIIYQEKSDLVELSIPGTKLNGARSVLHSCRATVILKDGRVTDVRFASVPEWLVTGNHCGKIFARCF